MTDDLLPVILAHGVRVNGTMWLANGSKDHFRTAERQFPAARRDGRLEFPWGAGHLAPLAAPADVTRFTDNAAFRLELPHRADRTTRTSSVATERPGLGAPGELTSGP